MTLPLVAILILALAGLPLFLILAAIALAGFHQQGLNSGLYFAELLRLTENPNLVAIPLFTLAGYLLAESRASARLVRLADAAIGWLPGGLALVTLAVMALLTAFTGASGVTIIAMGGMMLPVMLQSGYPRSMSLGLITVSGSIGLLFPPSLPLILYGVFSQTSIDKLFKAGVLPGLLFIIAIGAYVVRKSIKAKVSRKATRGDLWPALKSASGEIILPIVVVGGIYGGLFTASEAAIATVAYLMILEMLIHRDLSLRFDLPRIMREASVLVGGILLILGSAMALTNYLIYADVTAMMLNWMQQFVTSKAVFLLLLNIFLLAVGSVMEMFSAIIVVVSLVLPLATHYGVDPIHLGIIFLANLEIGYCTPPMGLNLFLSSFRFNRPIVELYRAAIPYLLIELAILALITYVPLITLYPVNLLSGR